LEKDHWVPLNFFNEKVKRNWKKLKLGFGAELKHHSVWSGHRADPEEPMMTGL